MTAAARTVSLMRASAYAAASYGHTGAQYGPTVAVGLPTAGSPHGHGVRKELGSTYYQSYIASTAPMVGYPSSPLKSPVPGSPSTRAAGTANFQSPIRQPQAGASTYTSAMQASTFGASPRVGVSERREELLYSPARGLLGNHPPSSPQPPPAPASPAKEQPMAWPANVVDHVSETMSNLAAQRLRYSHSGGAASPSPVKQVAADPPASDQGGVTSSSAREPARAPEGTSEHRSYYDSYQDRINQSRERPR